MASRQAASEQARSRYTLRRRSDPLAPPVDLAEALDAIGEDVMAGYSPERAMREFLRRGGQDQRGLDDLARRVAEQAPRADPAAQPRRHAPGGPGAPRPRRARGAQAAGPRRRRWTTATGRCARCSSTTCRPSTAAAVSELSSYDWQSREAREDYEKIKDLLGREMLDQRFAGMKQALENATDEDRAAINEMLADLNELLEKHRRGEDTARGLRRVHGQARGLLPGEPAEHRRAARRAGPARRGRPADAQLDDRRAARGADGARRSRRSARRR